MAISSIYKIPLALLTDLYQLTMAQGYWTCGAREHEAVFHLFFRRHPFRGGYSLFAGLDYVADFLEDFRFGAEDITYLGQLNGADGKPLFKQGFLDYLGGLKLSCQVDAVAEGSVVFPNAPLLRVQGSLIECQLLETALLNMVNFQTLIATKASRIVAAAEGDPVMDFGLRRAQGIDGSLSASRAAWLGGCVATSNVLAGRLFGIPPKGTHAHSWILAFDSEEVAFRTYAEAMPNNCIFLVDTYDSLQGVGKAIAIGRELQQKGHQMLGIRLDSGDLAQLSIKARKMLDDAGFPKARIVASNDLDEYEVLALKKKGAAIDTWGVGTRLVTAYDQPALGGVYKLAAIRAPGAPWSYRLKLSEEKIKVSNPGVQQVRRYRKGKRFVADVIYNMEQGIDDGRCVLPDGEMRIPDYDSHQDLLQPLFAAGECVQERVPLEDARSFAQEQLASLDERFRSIHEPATYPIGLDHQMAELKDQLIRAAGKEPV